MTVTDLPRCAADTARWVPTRAGILNVWRYYDEVFEFHKGRLLLRGPNGSGKSKALEVLLPFLFDANLRANRLSTFGTGERTMHWNLMGEGATGTTRVGYVWLEFRAGDRWFTCGARLQASTHTTTVHPEYFTTELRIGSDFSLVTEAGQPLTKNALMERLGERGTVHGSAADYRTEVRTSLFPSLSEQRYDALILALLQLRTPKLSQRLDPGLLSNLLSRALPPLGQQEIADLAEGFERLDSQRDKLTKLDEEVAATRTLAARQKTYAQRVLRAGAAALTSATTDLENLAKAARASAEEHTRVEAEKTAAEDRVAALEKEISAAESRKAGLTESDAYKQGQELDRLRERTAEAKKRATRIREDADRKRAEAEADQAAVHKAEQAERRHLETVQAQQTDIRHAAARAGLTSVHTELVRAPGRPLLRAALRAKREQLGEVGHALDSHERAVEVRQQAENDLDLARTAFSQAQQALDTAAVERESVLTDLGTRLADWAAGCRELRFDDPSAVSEQAESESAVLALVETAALRGQQEITTLETARSAALTAAERTRGELATEVEKLSAEHDIPPDAPATRTADRTRMTGAPLWRLVDFADSTTESSRASIEAALEASGLLDAWLGPRGEIEGHDLFADPYALPAVAGSSLADVLVPENDGARRLLSSVAFGEVLPDEPAAIGADGSWRIGNLTGSWQKDHATYVGSAARQRARQRRIQDLQDQISDQEAEVASLERELTSLRNRRQVLEAEREGRPGHGPLIIATQALTRAEAEVGAANRVVRERVDTVTAREGDVTKALRQLTSLAAEHGLPADRTGLSTVESAVSSFHDQAESWLEALEDLHDARRVLTVARDQARRSAAGSAAREEEAVEAEVRYEDLATTLEAVDSTFKVEYHEVLTEITELRKKLGALTEERRATAREVTELAVRLGEFGARREADAHARDEAAARRDVAAHRFRQLATGVFPADSGLDDLTKFEETLRASEGVRAALDAARLVTTAWPTMPHAPKNLGDALHRLSESVHTCRSALSARADLDLETDEDVQIFTAVVDGLRVGATELLHILHTEAEDSRHEITERERELFDQTLTGDTRRHLAARIRQANELVDDMNARLERVRTASKVAVRLVWQVAPDLPPGTKAARELLLKDPVRLSDDDRQSLHQFFRERIEQARADDTATTWEEQLAQVFDYTSWHRFVVKVDRANGNGWELLTRKLHGALSGGEKAIALHLPLFAAVAAHYQAVPEAPRVILLDEVFVGVDTTNRGQVFALLAALDLDLMLTSDHEWCTYAELSGVGIHQLITGGDGDDAVTTARFTWDGSALIPEE
ncbi:TIGR02680 family protein [Amycolatopsis sp. YIM 10]|uniref:TIGR02680 family protein n=1 Tax=Amycolatopsis sp. YIM 10 TaxID=2653857 RepID=UPI0012904D11|nr:TIGR02680 family protein [Amycolatopsis sp. YIM 10]QFU86082.1 Chromosome partition protein Smc [Amycolatopsis sp. YIM 10]